MIPKLNTETFDEKCWKFVYFGVYWSKVKVKVTSHKKTLPTWVLHSCVCWLLLII